MDRMTSGVINIDKPSEWTSHDVVAKIRGLLRPHGIERVGHAGTLDPFATGVLPICFGAATKISAHIMNGDKEYDVACQLGTETDTGDVTGKILRHCEPPPFSMTDLSEVLSTFMGTTLQTPPIYSAIKVQGVPLYKLARRGISVERTPRPVTIKRLQLNKINGDCLYFNVVCSKGTYIRTLCTDIGTRLGTLGYAAAIRRLRSGPFSIGQSIPLDQFVVACKAGGWEQAIIPIDEAIQFLPTGL